MGVGEGGGERCRSSFVCVASTSTGLRRNVDSGCDELRVPNNPSPLVPKMPHGTPQEAEEEAEEVAEESEAEEEAESDVFRFF